MSAYRPVGGRAQHLAGLGPDHSVVHCLNYQMWMGGLTDHITLEETGAMVVPFGVTALLPALTGLNRAREMLFLGERYEAQALLEMGVAWRVVADEQLIDSARETALRLAQLPPLSVRAMKRVLRHTSSADFEQALRLESEATVAGFMDPQTTRLRKDF